MKDYESTGKRNEKKKDYEKSEEGRQKRSDYEKFEEGLRQRKYYEKTTGRKECKRKNAAAPPGKSSQKRSNRR